MKYRVSGPVAICGVAPGGVVDLGSRPALNVAALVEAGHVQHLAPDDGELKPLEELTVPELREYADRHGIDLGEARLKADVLAAIREGEQ